MKKFHIAILVLIVTPFFFIKSSNISNVESYPELTFSSSNAFVYRNTAFSFNSKFNINASSYGYESKLFSFDHSDPEKNIFLEELSSQVIFKITPLKKYKLFINNIEIDDLKDISLIKGNYKYRIEQNNYLTYESTLTIDRYSEQILIPIILQLIDKKILLSSIPEGAVIQKNSLNIGFTPIALTLNEGINNFELIKDGFKDKLVTIDANNNKFEQFSFKLEVSEDLLSISSYPPSSSIFIDKEYIGITPITTRNPKKGSLLIKKYGYIDLNYDLKSSDKFLKFELDKDLSNVIFNIEPKVKIFINDEFVANSPANIKLQKIKQKLSLTANGYRTITKFIEPNSDTFQIRESLLTEKQAVLDESPLKNKNSIGLNMILFQPGSIKLGSSKKESRRDINEIERNVSFTKHFYISDNLITETQFNLFKKTANDSNLPVNNISWTQAAQFCNWLSIKEGLLPFYKFNNNQLKEFNSKSNGYRLPTEAEWEYVSKSNSKENLVFSWGENRKITKVIGNIADESTSEILANFVADYTDGYVERSPVGLFKSNQNSLFDLTGNLSEWTNDFYSADILSPDIILEDYFGPLFGSRHVIKGSNYNSALPQQLGLSYRTYGNEGNALVGFRIARWIY